MWSELLVVPPLLPPISSCIHTRMHDGDYVLQYQDAPSLIHSHRCISFSFPRSMHDQSKVHGDIKKRIVITSSLKISAIKESL